MATNRQELIAKAKELGVEDAYKKKNVELEEAIAAAGGDVVEAQSENEQEAPSPADSLPVDVPQQLEIVEEVAPQEWPRTFGQAAVLYTDEASQVLHDDDGNLIHPLNRSYGVEDLRAKKRLDKDDEEE